MTQAANPSEASPFAPGSVSLRCYPHLDLPAPAIVEELRAQAALAVEHGFDGVMTSEHHGGFAGYLPNPLQTAAFALDAMPTGWAAPCPLLLPLRPTALVIEEVAWLAARHPGRVGLGVAAGALPVDFEIMDTTMDDLTARFAGALEDRHACARRWRRGRARGRRRRRAVPRTSDPGRERGGEHHSCQTRGRGRRRSRVRFAVDAGALSHARRRVSRRGRAGPVRAHPARVDRRAPGTADRARSSTSTATTRRPARPRTGAPTSSRPRPTRSRSRAGSSTRPAPPAPTR